jgi:DNA-3-methyladenine glycosylase II
VPPPSPSELHDLRAELVRLDPRLARAHAQTPAFEWRTRPGGFAGLLKLIVEQQVSTASAAAIWARVAAGLGEVTPERLLEHDEAGLKAFGLSAPKARYAREIALADAQGRVRFTELSALSDADAVVALTAIKGVGRWTAEIYLMFCEGRRDLFPGADIALQEAMRWADGSEARPDTKTAYARAEAWGPHRSAAAHLLWAWYGAARRGEIERPLPVSRPT